MKPLLFLAVSLVFVTPASANGLFVYGDSIAVFTKPYLLDQLPGWRVRQDVEVTRTTQMAIKALKQHRLPRAIHLSVGTVDEPRRGKFRERVRRVMRTVGPDRCVVWANIARARRPRDEERDGRWHWNSAWTKKLNPVLEQEDARWPNLVVVDWLSMVKAHEDWVIDGAHVSERGSKARARVVARAAKTCVTNLPR